MSVLVEMHLFEEGYDLTQNITIVKKECGKTYIGRLEWDEHKVGHAAVEPTIRAPITSTNNLFSELRAGLKRLGQLNDINQATLDAKDEHLQDMRKIAFQKINPPIIVTEDTE